MIKRLRLKFIGINMTIVTVMLLIIFGTVLHFAGQNMERESISMMQAIAMDPMRLGRPDEPFSGVQLPYFTLQIGRDGRLIAAGGGYYDLSDKEFLYELIEQVFSSKEQTGVVKGYPLRFFRSSTPTVQCLVFVDISSEINTMRSLIKSCLLIGAASFLAFWGISLLLARWAVKPVDQAWKQQRQFVSDASHELKTPLTVILTNAEMLQATGEGSAVQRQFIDNILVMSRQMRELIESLLELARVDNGMVQKELAQVDLSKLVSDTVLPFEPVYFERGLELSCSVEEGIQVQGSPRHLRQVAEILLDNAQKYASHQGVVTVTLQKSGGKHCLLSVSNPGREISGEDLVHIFKRFYRLDEARSRNGSYGLGLAIAQGIVQEHHGKIWAQSSQGINTFFVRLPIHFTPEKHFLIARPDI